MPLWQRPAHLRRSADYSSHLGRPMNPGQMHLCNARRTFRVDSLPVAVRRGDRTSRPLSSAARADFDQTIKSHVILFDSLSQSVLVGVGLVNAI